MAASEKRIAKVSRPASLRLCRSGELSGRNRGGRKPRRAGGCTGACGEVEAKIRCLSPSLPRSQRLQGQLSTAAYLSLQAFGKHAGGRKYLPPMRYRRFNFEAKRL